MTVYIIKKQKSKTPLKYHTSWNCPMPKGYQSAYMQVPKPPPGYTPCERSGPCRG
jgi:hypothetical protein